MQNDNNGSFRKKSVLIIDQDEASASALEVNLRRVGFRTLVADGVGGAQDLLTPDLHVVIINEKQTALGDPDVNRIATLAMANIVPVVLLAADSGGRSASGRLPTLAHHVLVKPFEMRKLIHLIVTLS